MKDLTVALANEPGTLADAFETLARAGISMLAASGSVVADDAVQAATPAAAAIRSSVRTSPRRDNRRRERVRGSTGHDGTAAWRPRGAPRAVASGRGSVAIRWPR